MRRYQPHCVWPFAHIMTLGERKIPSSSSGPLSDARTPLADFFSILLAGFTRVYAIDCKAWVIRLLATSIANTCMKTARSTPTKNLTTAALSSAFVTCHSLVISKPAATSWPESRASRVNFSNLLTARKIRGLKACERTRRVDTREKSQTQRPDAASLQYSRECVPTPPRRQARQAHRAVRNGGLHKPVR